MKVAFAFQQCDRSTLECLLRRKRQLGFLVSKLQVFIWDRAAEQSMA